MPEEGNAGERQTEHIQDTHQIETKELKKFGGIDLSTFVHSPAATMSLSGDQKRERGKSRSTYTQSTSPGPKKKNDVIAREFPELQHVSYRR